ncbi:hypothetical protein LHK99_20760 [Klebsiella quasipneumoniae]|uniref:hypothetical protein n=1 Tax=Klebsiella quasipneumoniae TaxID=1463165 RepID=UPI001CF96BEA|nr:hypothetical protein [Klebsiella quasipneumoniae]MCB4713123.1 hypothetical protein [Klebsiella quasipneumoniae]
MPFYLTRDPVPSADMRNVFDNAQNLDLALNDLTSSLWTDRLGRSRMSWFGLESAFSVKLSDFESRFTSQIVEQEATFDASQADKENRFQHFLVSSGYVFLGDYEDGPFQFSARNQYIRYNNQYYRLNAATDVGFTTTGTDATSFANDVTHFVLMDGDTLRQDLASREYGLGAYLDGWARNYSCEVAANVAVFLSAQKINLWEYQHLCVPKVGDQTTLDWAPALLKALKDGAKNRKAVYAPGIENGYYVSKIDEILTNLDTSGAESRMSVYALVGDGANNTRFYSDEMSSPVMELSLCRLMWKGWSLSGPGINSTYGIKLGEATTISAVRLSYIEDVKVGWFSNPLVVGHMWDSIFNNLHIQNWGRNAVYIQERTDDNSNNLTFNHMQLEPTEYAGSDTCRGFVCMGGSTANTKHHSIKVNQPHVEPRNWNCQHFYISNCVGVDVDVPSINRNNSMVDDNGDALVANANIAPAVRIISSVGVHFNGGQITHIGPRADDIAPIIKVEGIVKDIRFSSYIDTGRASVANFAGGIDLSNSPNASREVYFDGAPVGSFTSFSSVRNMMRLSVMANIQRTVSALAEQYSITGTTDTGTVLKFLMGNTADPSTAPTEIMRLYSEGYLYNKGYVSPTVTIAAGASYTHIVGAGVNNRRGEYKITGLEDDNTLFGSFFNVPNKAPKPTGIIGDGINLSQAKPDSSVTNKLCIYQSGQYIVLENRRSTSVTLAIRFDSGIS